MLVNTGDGKGKSSAAFGVVLRAVARDWKVAVVQFLKSGEWHVGEEDVATRLGVDWWALGEGFTWDSDDLTAGPGGGRGRRGPRPRRSIQAGAHRLVVLDEITYPMTWGWIDTDDVVATIRDRPERRSTSSRPAATRPRRSIDVADTVTEMRKVKHAYDAGIAAKKGIDY